MEDDDWEAEWENKEFTIRGQNKREEEQKMVEEADKALAMDLFSTTEKTQSSHLQQGAVKTEPLPLPKTKVCSNQKKNEEKQKQLAKAIKERREKRQREEELFGAATEDDEYAEYENKLYSQLD